MNGSSSLYRSGLWFCLIAATGVVSWHREKDNRLGRSDLAGFAFWRRARRVLPTVSTRWLNQERSKPRRQVPRRLPQGIKSSLRDTGGLAEIAPIAFPRPKTGGLPNRSEK